MGTAYIKGVRSGHKRVADALLRYLKVHGRRILSNAEGQKEVKIEIRALFRYYEREGQGDKLMDHIGGFSWRGCRVEGGYVVVPTSLVREVVGG